MKNIRRGLGIALSLILLSGTALLLAQSKSASHPVKSTAYHSAAKPAEPPSSETIIRFVREKFGTPSAWSMILDAFHPSANPHYLDSIIRVDDGQNTNNSKRSSALSVSKDGKWLIIAKYPALDANASSFLPLGPETKQDIDRRVHDAYRIPDSLTVKVGPYKSTPFPNFLATDILVEDATHKQTVDAYVTGDHRFLVLGDIFNMEVDPVREALHVLVLQNQPATGPHNAPVTMVEFADLECPVCSRAHEFLEKNLLPTYEGKIRVVFKEFPLPMHEWASAAAIANQCAYRINPSDYLPYRTLIYQHQTDFEAIKANAAEVRDKLLDFGQQAGIDRLQLAGCVDSKASLPRIEANVKEGKSLNVTSTPTFFINGRIVAGAQPETIYQAVDAALADAKKKK